MNGALTELLLRSFGPRQVIAEELVGLEGVQAAYLYGSWAARYTGEEGRPPNDIDVLVIGQPDRDRLDEVAERAGRRLAREVNVTDPRNGGRPATMASISRSPAARSSHFSRMTWQPGSQRVAELLTAGELEQVTPDDGLAWRLLQDAQRHIGTATIATGSGDLAGAYQLAYDAFRKSGAALLAAQGLRATSRGGHVAIQDAINAQFGNTVRVFRSFGRIRRARRRWTRRSRSGSTAALDRLGRTWGVSPHSLVRRMVERGRTTESSARRAYQRLANVHDPSADPTNAYPGEVPTLLKKAAELAADHGAGVPALAEALKLSTRQVRDLLGEVDQRPVLRLVADE